jgi:inosine/xanthosine triphosphate pyrophosphatase family protein
MTALMSIVVATSNRGKLAELRSMLADLPVDILSMADALPQPLTVVEDGETFEHNARKKATEVCQATMMVTLADDSGLEVDALGGRPGVRSARFSLSSPKRPRLLKGAARDVSPVVLAATAVSDMTRSLSSMIQAAPWPSLTRRKKIALVIVAVP